LDRDRSYFSTLVVLTIIIMLALGVSCSLDKPKAPSWITTWRLPVSNAEYNIVEALNSLDEFDVIIDSNGIAGFEFNGEIDTLNVGNNLSIDANDFSFEDSIGILEIPPPSGAGAEVNLEDIFPIQFGFIPPISFDLNLPLPEITDYTWMDVDSGNMVITLTNTFDADLDTVIIIITDLSDNHIIGISAIPGGLPDNSTKSDTISLDGQRISNLFEVSFHGATLDTSYIQNPTEPHQLIADVGFSEGLTVTAGQTETPEIIIVRNNSVTLTDSTQITTSTISSGIITARVENTSNIPFSVTVSSSNIQLNGSDLTINQLVGGMSEIVIVKDLEGYNLSPADSAGMQVVYVNFEFNAPSSSPIQHVIDKSDGALVDLEISPIEFSSVTGRVTPIWVDFDPTSHDLNFPDGVDQARLTEARMIISLYNDSQVPFDLSLNISGGDESLQLNERIAGKLSPFDPPMLNEIIIEGDELVEFLSPAPDSLYISGQSIINPDYEFVTISNDDNISGNINLSSPFTLVITEAFDMNLDISDKEIDPSMRPANFDETFRSGIVELEVESHLPLNIALTVYFSNSSDTSVIYNDPSSLIIGPDTLAAGILNEFGQVIESRFLSLSIDLLSENLAVFDNDTIYMAPVIRLLPTGSGNITLMGDDYISIRANAVIEILMSDNFWE